MNTQGRVQTSDMLRECIFDGQAWVASVEDTDIDTNDVLQLYFQVPANGTTAWAYWLLADCRFTGTGNITLGEDPTCTDVGTANAAIAINRANLVTVPVTVTKAPTISDYGTTLMTCRIEGSGDVDDVRIGTQVNPAGVFQLAPGKKYVLELKSNTDNKKACIVAEIYRGLR